MKVCKNCGAQNRDTSLFCEECGTRLEEAPVAGTPVTDEPAAPEGAFSGQPEQDEPQQNVYRQSAQQNVYQQPAYNAVPQEPEKKSGNWMTITSLILSILSIVCCCLDVFALILAIASIVLAIIALVQHKGNKGMAIASLIVGIIGFLTAIYLLIYAFVILPNNPALQSQIMELYDELGVTGFIW